MVSQLLLPATAGPSFKQTSNARERFVRFNRGEDHNHVLPGDPDPILLPAPWQPEPAVFEYDNINWLRVPAIVRREGLLAVESLMDQMAAFFVGEMSETDFDQAVRSFRNKMFAASPTPMMTPPPMPKPKRQQQTPSGVQLGKLLKDWLDIDAFPVREVYEPEGWRYQLYNWPTRSGILIQRRKPDGRTYLSGSVAYNRAEAQAIVADLEKQYTKQAQRRVITQPAATDGERPIKAVIEHGDPEPAAANPQPAAAPSQAERDAFQRGFERERQRQAAAQAKRDAYTTRPNPFEVRQ